MQQRVQYAWSEQSPADGHACPNNAPGMQTSHATYLEESANRLGAFVMQSHRRPQTADPGRRPTSKPDPTVNQADRLSRNRYGQHLLVTPHQARRIVLHAGEAFIAAC